MLVNGMLPQTPSQALTLDYKDEKNYPCSDDHVVIGLKARRLGQIARDQSQDDCNCGQRETYEVRNQDLAG